MIWIAVILLSIALFTGAAAVGMRGEARASLTGITLIMVVMGLVLGLSSSVTVVSAGNVGVMVTFGSVSDRPLPSGICFVNPFCHIEEMSVRTENYWMSHQHTEGSTQGDDAVQVRSSNGLQMPVDLSVPYRLVPESAPWVYKNFGTHYVTNVLRPALSTAARRAASHYVAEELYSTKRDEFAEQTRILLEEEVTRILRKGYEGKDAPESVVVLSQVLIGHVGLPDTVKTAIEEKLKMDQAQQAMDFQIMKEKKEAERKQVEAQGIKQFQDIVTTGISDKLLRWKAIDATLHLAESKNAKLVIIGSGKDGLPVLLGGETDEPMVQVK